jgi:hypothetical protein
LPFNEGAGISTAQLKRNEGTAINTTFVSCPATKHKPFDSDCITGSGDKSMGPSTNLVTKLFLPTTDRFASGYLLMSLQTMRCCPKSKKAVEQGRFASVPSTYKFDKHPPCTVDPSRLNLVPLPRGKGDVPCDTFLPEINGGNSKPRLKVEDVLRSKLSLAKLKESRLFDIINSSIDCGTEGWSMLELTRSYYACVTAAYTPEMTEELMRGLDEYASTPHSVSREGKLAQNRVTYPVTKSAVPSEAKNRNAPSRLIGLSHPMKLDYPIGPLGGLHIFQDGCYYATHSLRHALTIEAEKKSETSMETLLRYFFAPAYSRLYRLAENTPPPASGYSCSWCHCDLTAQHLPTCKRIPALTRVEKKAPLLLTFDITPYIDGSAEARAKKAEDELRDALDKEKGKEAYEMV